MSYNSVDFKEIEHFSKDSASWWDEDGAFAPLHRLSPVRMEFICGVIRSHYGLDGHKFDGLKMLDIGCGGGLVCEPLARLSADVTGADADAQAIAAAQEHAAISELDIRYLNMPAEKIDEQFDVVLALEIIEHVQDPALFVQEVSRLCKPGGLVIFSTLNRNAKSLALGIGAAEYILRWVPRGTHDWKKFIKPSELATFMRKSGLSAQDMCGIAYDPLTQMFKLDRDDIDVNYFMTARA